MPEHEAENFQRRKKANKKLKLRDNKKTLCDKGKNRFSEEGVPIDQCEKCQEKMMKELQKTNQKLKFRYIRSKGRRIAKEAREVHNYI